MIAMPLERRRTGEILMIDCEEPLEALSFVILEHVTSTRSSFCLDRFYVMIEPGDHFKEFYSNNGQFVRFYLLRTILRDVLSVFCSAT